jgi:hypothetical protein
MSGKIIRVSIRRIRIWVEVVATQGLFSFIKVAQLATWKQIQRASSG